MYSSWTESSIVEKFVRNDLRPMRRFYGSARAQIQPYLKNEQSMRDLKIEYRNYNEVIKLYQ